MDDKPYVAVACLADKVLMEKDGVISLIRVIDKFTVAIPPGLPDDIRPTVETTLVTALRYPNFKGALEITIKMHGPTEAAPAQTFAAEFPGGWSSGSNMITTLLLGVKSFGECRIELWWEDQLLSVVPFTLEQREAQPDSPASGPTK